VKGSDAYDASLDLLDRDAFLRLRRRRGRGQQNGNTAQDIHAKQKSAARAKLGRGGGARHDAQTPAVAAAGAKRVMYHCTASLIPAATSCVGV
jgi:hypothetical protein